MWSVENAVQMWIQIEPLLNALLQYSRIALNLYLEHERVKNFNEVFI